MTYYSLDCAGTLGVGLFRIKDLRKLQYWLGITIAQNEAQHYLKMHQEQCILNMLVKFKMTEAKTIATPLDISVKLQKDDSYSNEVDPVRYQSVIRSLLYATCPDVAQVVGIVSKYSCRPSKVHFTATKRILCYLKGMAGLAVKYSKSSNEALISYSDTDWAGDCDDRHSTGNLFLIAKGPISWMSKKQRVIVLSMSGAEYS